jgi:pyruvate/2-oxoglutarate dehydrogenase complex dihydrolipoamide dehydrogenase (E3) component
VTAAKHFDLIVIGSGSAGSSCWYAARQLGKSVAVFEAEVLGGECPTFACVPTKALLQCAEVYDTVVTSGDYGIEPGQVRFNYAKIKARKDRIIGQTGAALGEKPYHDMGVELFRRRARFVSETAIEAGGDEFSADRFLIASGASQRLPEVAGLAETGYLTFREAIDLTELPGSIVIMGGGAVGCEFAQLFSSFGAKVTIIDRNSRLLHREDDEVGDFMGAHFQERGVELLLEATLLAAQRDGPKKRITVRADGVERDLICDEILVATGKTPNTDLGLNLANIAYGRNGVPVDETLRTTNPNVYAAGDVTGPYQFTHAASYQGNIACYNMFHDEPIAVDYRAMPRCVFTFPEVALVGATEAEARQQGPVRIGFSPLEYSDRALTSGHEQGFVKVIADGDGRLVGGAIVAPRAGEMVQELVLAIALGATAEQVAATVHAFPTYSEAVAAACAEV